MKCWTSIHHLYRLVALGMVYSWYQPMGLVIWSSATKILCDSSGTMQSHTSDPHSASLLFLKSASRKKKQTNCQTASNPKYFWTTSNKHSQWFGKSPIHPSVTQRLPSHACCPPELRPHRAGPSRVGRWAANTWGDPRVEVGYAAMLLKCGHRMLEIWPWGCGIGSSYFMHLAATGSPTPGVVYWIRHRPSPGFKTTTKGDGDRRTFWFVQSVGYLDTPHMSCQRIHHNTMTHSS